MPLRSCFEMPIANPHFDAVQFGQTQQRFDIGRCLPVLDAPKRRGREIAEPTCCFRLGETGSLAGTPQDLAEREIVHVQYIEPRLFAPRPLPAMRR
jgi:hypothetical protein